MVHKNKSQKKKPLYRVLLAVGGADKNRIEKAAASLADVVFCDLEDAVAPAPNQKALAREITCAALNDLNWGNKTLAVRINGLDTPFWQADIEFLLKNSGEKINQLIVPKVNSSKEIHKVEKLLTKLEKKLKLKNTLALACLIETIEGLENSHALASCSPRIETLIFGAGDFAAQMGMKLALAQGRDFLYYPRFKLVAAARLAGLDVIDAPFFDFKDEAGFTQACRYAAALGFDGKMVIHPAQIEAGLKTFTPSQEEVARARKVVAAYAQAQKEGSGAIAIDGEMIDVATAKLYQNTIDKAVLCGL